ncbi:uncharacterized protein LOC114437112 isoform X2 [Parambassis ranga]|nr:uncharacterized protein LOC114437112 isoform X2 [Parambassis ranga]
MENILKSVVALVLQHPDGIPLKKIAVFYNQKYHSNLTLSKLGFDSMASLVASLDQELIVLGERVFHRDHVGAAGAGATPRHQSLPKAAQQSKKADEVLKTIVAMIKEHPAGIPLSMIAINYSQKYHHNLVLASLGFKNISSLVESLKDDLIVIKDTVFHKIHQPPKQPQAGTLTNASGDSRPATPKTPDPLARNNSPAPPTVPVQAVSHSVSATQASAHLLGPPLVAAVPVYSTNCAPVNPTLFATKPAEDMTQQQLYQRVLEVIRTYQLTAPSMDQLQEYYCLLFAETFPISQYMSLYDSLETKKQPPQAEPAAVPKTAAWQTPAATKEQQPAAGLGISTNLDFPALGAEKSLAKEQKSKVRDGNQRECSGPVFRDAYHAQLREVLGSNMRAVEAIEEDEEGVTQRRKRPSDMDALNSLMESVKRDIAAEGELVTKEKVISRVCMLMPTLDPGKLNPWTIPALKDLRYIMREINMFIESTEAVTSLCTLYELGQSLAGLKDKKRYEELNLGPLCKLPLVHRMFKINPNTKDDDIRQIETVDILKQLRIFRKNQSKVKVDLAEFLKYLADHYNCDSPYELGIRINSVGLPISSLMKVSRGEHLILERAREVILKELEEETYERLRKIKKSILEPVQGAGSFSFTGNLDLRKKYASMSAADVVLAVFSNAEGVFSPRMASHVQSFLEKVSGDRLATALFQLSICGGSLAVPQDLVLKDNQKTSKATEQSRPEDKATTPLPSEAKVKQYLKESLAAVNTAITLAHIASLEKKLAKHFHVKDFLSLEQGNFLDFLVKNIQLLQDTLGSTLILGSSSMDLGSGFRPSRQDVFEFIKQCGDISSTDPDELTHIESGLRVHFKVQDSRELGYGTLHMLAGLVQRQRGLAGGGLSQVYYESALFAKHSKSSPGVGCETVGCLGEMSKAQALASLLSCPLLENLSEWSQWELIFKPLHGSLKDFIERNADNTGLAALEVTPGLLLRITTHTGDKPFSSAAMALDPVGTAGHLVSIVVADGIVNAPIALLANHMESSLAAAVATEDLSQAEEDVSCYGRVANFLLASLTRIPTRTCQALLQQVFLEPFSRVLGQAKSKQVLIAVAQSNTRHLNCLHRLGVLLGVTDWVKDYQKKLNPEQSQSYNTQAAPMDQTKSNLIDSVSSSLSALNVSEDEDVNENVMDCSFASSQLDENLQVNGHVQIEEEEDEEELYELSSLLNGETSNVSSEAEGSEMEEPLEKSDAEGQSETSQKALIGDIRKSEFGIGVELNAEGQKLMQVHQERLGRSLDRLSTELYSKDTHFVLELIQNADDNSYPSEAGVVPALAFVVERDCITVLNNEIGFQERNIRAICDVGRSTKGKHKYGYIGQKGIGFKSVFKVTDCPEIHSNGFHLRFDKNCGPMGYILPHWTEEERPLDAQLKGVNQHSWTTKISLPLRSESHQTRNLFHDVHPSLLLFLHRLRSITISNQSEKRLVTMTRKDLSHNVLEVEHTDGIERWLVVKTTLEPKKIKDGIESTELALAFQLNSDTGGDDIVCQPQKQPVFAYLPLRSFGFRFIIQGDFDIPSSREDVDRDSSWNQWLRSEIPQLFLQAMDVFTDHPEFSRLKGLCQFLQFVPLPDEVLDFFKPVAGQIIQLLKGKPFLPTLSSDGEVVYKLPSQVAVCQDPVIRDVIGRDELERHLSLFYLHPGLSPAPPASLLAHLGVRYLKGSDVTTVTTAMAKELRMEGIQTDGSLRQLGRLLVCNFRALEHGYGEGDCILQTLRDLPIFPLADGRVVTLSGDGVFFPVEETKTKKKKAKAQTVPSPDLYNDINVIHPSLLSCLEPLESQQVRELLRRLGVHEMEPQELLEQHIYPSLRSNKWKSKPSSVVVSYLIFIKQYSSSSQEYSDIAVPVQTSRGLLRPYKDRVHFSEEYGNINLPKKLPGCDWTLLSPCYVETDGDVAGWRELFGKLGVRDGLIIRKERQTLTAKELASSPWSAEGAVRHQTPGEAFVLDDYPCEEFHGLATAQLPDHLLLQQRMALLELLETNWDTGHRYSQYITAQVVDSDGQPVRSIKSSFYHHLCRLEWLPASRPQQGELQDRKYLCPSSVYLTSPDVTRLLGTHVYYVDINSSDFSRALGMRETISVEVLINYLKEWCVKPQAETQEPALPENESEGADFTSTVQHIQNVYTYLHTNCPPSTLKELFQHTPAVFVEHNRHNDGWCSGRFYHLKEVCWSDPTTLFQRYRQLTHRADSPVQQPRVLAPFYSQLDGMRDFFNRLKVDRSPNMKQYVGLLELICSSSPIPTAEVLQDVSVLYARLAEKCKLQGPADQEIITQYKLDRGYCSTLKGMVSDKRVFPAKDNSWVSLARKPMICDSKELEKIFKQHKQVCLLDLPPAERTTQKHNTAHKNNFAAGQRATAPKFNENDRFLFLEICGIRQLSHCVRSEPQTELLQPCPSMQAMVRSVIPYIQRFLYHHDELSGVYSELTDGNIAEKIKHLYFGQVCKLYIRYQLDVADGEESVIEVQDVICLLKDEKELYIQKDHLSAHLDICRELVKLFCTDTNHSKELMRFLSGLITSLSDPGALRRYLMKEDIRELPGEEEQWEVPEPPKPEMNLDRVLSRRTTTSDPQEEPLRPAQEDGEQTLVCWPPRASIQNTGTSCAGQGGSGVVEAVMKMWPPPAGPQDREKEVTSARASSQEGNQQPLKSSRPAEQLAPQRVPSHPEQPNMAAVTGSAATPQSPERSQQTETTDRAERGEGSLTAPTQSAPSAPPAEPASNQPAPNSLAAPEAVVLSSSFQGTAADTQRPPLNLDRPLWNKVQPSQATLEDMELKCQRPTTVVLCDDNGDLGAIGEWGEELVNSFLCHWRDSGVKGAPTHVLWCNQSGESGQPYDFKLTLDPAETVYVEVKSTVRKEKSFIHLSANELDLALREKERYHVYRVYSAGDAQNVRLCRIRNLAQHLHTKDLALYLFV